MFLSTKKQISKLGSPFLVTATGSVIVPENATRMLAYIIGGGGSGGAQCGNAGGETPTGGGGGGGGAFIVVDLKKWTQEASLLSATATLVAGLTIGAGGTSRVTATFGSVNGNVGGTTTLTLTGGLSVSVGGGGGGGIPGGGAYGTMTPTFTLNHALTESTVFLRPLIAQPVTYASATFSGDVLASGGGAVSQLGIEAGSVGGSIPAALLTPWWMRAVGLTKGSGGSGAQITSSGKASGGGAAGFGGNGGAGAVSNSVGSTASAGSGYGSGGGGACGISGSTVTSGAGAPGCAAIVFELEV